MSRRRPKRESGPFALLPVDVLVSAAVRTLPHAAFRMLVILAAQYSGARNGSLSVTRQTLAQHGVRNPHIIGPALAELEARGLIVRTRPGTRIPPRSAMYAITWRNIDEPLSHDRHDALPTLSPSHAYARWAPATRGQHWTVQRRAPMYRRATSASSAGIHADAQISSAGIHAEASAPVAHGYPSHISVLGRSTAAGRRRRRAA